MDLERLTAPRQLAAAAAVVFLVSAATGLATRSLEGVLVTVLGAQAGTAMLVVAAIQADRRGRQHSNQQSRTELRALRREVKRLRAQRVGGAAPGKLTEIEKGLQRIHDAISYGGGSSGDDLTRVDRRLNVITSSADESVAHLSAVRSRLDELYTQVTTQIDGRLDSIRSSLEESSGHLGWTRASLQEIEQRLSTSAPAVGSGPNPEEQLDGLARGVKETYRQLEALLGLYSHIDRDRALPPLRGWPASPDLLLHLSTLVRRVRPKSILDVGSGASTLILALAARSCGDGRVIALEHQESYVQETQRLLEEFEVADWAEVRYAPLEPLPIGDEQYLWYAAQAIPDEDLGVVHVDGPPGKTRERARYPAGPLLLPRLAEGGALVLDDTLRADEQKCVDQWAELFPDLQVTHLPMEKGAVQFDRRVG